MGRIILFHGTPNKIVVPAFGLGDDKHDYGRGFYLTEDPELAKEWAVWEYSIVSNVQKNVVIGY